MLIVNRFLTGYVLFAGTVLFVAGCGQPIGGSGVAGTTSYADYVDNKTEAERMGWTELGMVFQEENDVEARLVPKQPELGKACKVELRFYCDFKLPEHYIWTRVGDNELGEIEDPHAGADWIKMSITGGQLWSHKKKKMVDISQTIQTPKKKQPGESTYEAELTFPPGKSYVEFKIDNQFGDEVLYKSAIEVNIAAPSKESGTENSEADNTASTAPEKETVE